MVGLEFLNQNNAPTAEAKLAFQVIWYGHLVDKTVVFLHDESTFQANDDQQTFWGTKGHYSEETKEQRVWNNGVQFYR